MTFSTMGRDDWIPFSVHREVVSVCMRDMGFTTALENCIAVWDMGGGTGGLEIFNGDAAQGGMKIYKREK